MSMTADHSTSVKQAMKDAVGAEIVSAGGAPDAIDGIVPQVVVSPRSTDELSRLLSIANKQGIAVAPRGGGTQLSIGNRMRRLDAIADMSGLNRVVEHNAADLTLVVEAGITLASLRTALAVEGQFLPLDAPLTERATIGGTLAAGVSGPLKWQYGSARDLVIGMKVAQADGRITQSGGNVVKNVSGYDMARLHVGGLGTLGIITEVSFKLTPIPRQEETIVAGFKTAAHCLDAAIGIFNSGVMPIAMTIFDSGVSTHDAMRRMGESSYILAVRLGGRPRTLERLKKEALYRICQHTFMLGGIKGDSRAFWSQLADFGHLEGDEALMSARIAVLPNRIGKVIEAVSQYRVTGIVTQPGYGMINAYWFYQYNDVSLDETIREVREKVHKLGGSLIVERAPLDVKDTLDVWDYTGESIDTMRRLKEQYDPNGILNPNRFAGGI